MYKPLFCQKCGQMMLDDKDVAELVLRVDACQGISKSIIDCPHCGFRWGIVITSDATGWIIQGVLPEALDEIYQAMLKLCTAGVPVDIISKALEEVIAKEAGK